MAYIPDAWVIGRLDIAQSAQRILFYYCARADQDSGTTNVSTGKVATDLNIRKDHIDEHDRKLVREGLISIALDEHGGRIITLSAPWQSRAARNGKTLQVAAKPATSQDLGKSAQDLGSDSQDLGSLLNESPKLGEIPQILGEVPQNLGKPSPKLGEHIGITSPINQPIEPAGEGNRPDTDAQADIPLDPVGAMAEAIADVMGLPVVPEGDAATQIFDAAREFVDAGVMPSDVADYENDFYRRKTQQGSRYVLTLKILREDVPGWVRSRRKLAEAEAKTKARPESNVVSMASVPAWQRKAFGLDKTPRKYAAG